MIENEQRKLRTQLIAAINTSNSDNAIMYIQQMDMNHVNASFSVRIKREQHEYTLHNYSLLHFAVDRGLVDVVNALLDKGANALAVTDNTKLSPLYVALERKKALAEKQDTSNFDQIIATLLEKEPKLCGIPGFIIGYTLPFHLAASSPYMTEQLRLILSCQDKVQMNIRLGNENGDTPLHLAAQCNNLEAVKLLVENCASITRRNDDYKTAAELTSNEDIKAYLEENKNIEHEKIEGALFDCRNYKDPAEAVALQTRANTAILHAYYEQRYPENSNNELQHDVDSREPSRFCVIS